jgi:hypothetical protein
MPGDGVIALAEDHMPPSAKRLLGAVMVATGGSLGPPPARPGLIPLDLFTTVAT